MASPEGFNATVTEQMPVTEDLQEAVEALQAPYTYLRDKAGDLFKVYFGITAEVQLANQISSAEHPLV